MLAAAPIFHLRLLWLLWLSREDPLVSGEYGARFVKAMQARSLDGKHQRVACAPKHFLDYDVEGRHDLAPWPPTTFHSRNDLNAIVSKQEQLEYFLPQWHAMVTRGQPSGIMCSTNRVNGVDACMNPTYLNGFLRERFNFSGFVVTDGNSCGNTNCRATVKLLKNATSAEEWGVTGKELAAGLCLSGGAGLCSLRSVAGVGVLLAVTYLLQQQSN